jgi:class 3 adenylate cyclase/predicted ATPase
MQCPNCGASNPDNKKYCTGCGSSLRLRCSACNGENPPQAKFCGDCGASLAAAVSTDVKQASDTSTLSVPEAERRQLTVMFCDLVGSTALAERLDPEELREVLARYQDACAEVIHRYEGHIARYVGDGLLVYFGYPQAHEDDAQRAVRTGLNIVDAIRELEAKIANPDVNLAVRIGTTTGLVVAGDIGSGERVEEKAIVGETPNIAARLQGLAEPNTVLIGAGTRRLVEGLFDCDDLGEHRLKGISRPVAAYRVRTESGAPSRFEAKAVRGLTPIVGRDEEVELLLKRWGRAKEGESQVVLLSGEAGVGKSRITRGLQERLHEVSNRVLYYGSPYHQNSALHPAIDQLERVLRFDEDESAAQKLDKLEAALIGLDLVVENHAPFLASLLSLPFNGRYRPLQLTPQELKNETFRILVSMIERMAGHDTVLMVVEDAQWIDPSTLELIGLLVEQMRAVRLLLLITFRPEFMPPWSRHTHVTALTLNRLGQKESAAMIAKITRGRTLPDEVQEQIIAKTDGVPLFVEELTKTVLESGLLKEEGDRYVLSGPLPALAIPTSLQDSLMARLDRLGAVKEVAELAATCGRTFSRELLLAVSVFNEDVIDNALRELFDAELIYRRGFPPHFIYEFKHALVQDTAYQALLKSTRQRYHHAIAQAVEREFPATAETQPEVVARHYTEAGLAEQAIGYWHRAGQRAVERSGNLEAIAHLTKGLKLIKTLKETPEVARQELQLYLTLGPALVAARHFADPSVGEAYARAFELCQRLEDKVHLPLVLRGRQAFHRLRGELRKARELGQQLVALAERQQDPALLVGGCHALGQDLFSLGELVAARQTVERGIALFDPEKHRLQNWPGGQPGEQCYLYDAFALWMLGYPDQALRRGEEALAMAEGLAKSANLINTLAFVVLIHALRREPAAVRERANATTEMSVQHKNPFLAWGTILHGWARAAQDQIEDGAAELDQGVAAYRATGSRTWLPCFLILQAETYARTKRIDDGLASLAEAFALIEKTEECCWQAELNRLRGELLITASRDHRAEAETCFSRAIVVARRQQAKSWELRAAINLARLWHDQGKRKEARDLLAPIYSWFTEGFDMADLKDAKALLDAWT